METQQPFTFSENTNHTVLTNTTSRLTGPLGDTLNNITFNITDSLFYLTLWTIVVPVLFSLITIIGITGNVMVVITILTNRKLRNSTNKFLINLAISDVVFLGTCVPFQAYKYAAFGWPFGDFWCKAIQYLLFVTAYVTIWTLVCVAAIRYVILVQRNSKMKLLLSGMCIEICSGLWILMCLVHIPTFMAHRVNTIRDYTYCGIDHPSTSYIIVSFFICAYVLPLSLICVLYVLVLCHLNNNEHTFKTRQRSFRSNHCVRVSKIVLMVVLCFGIMWLPLHLHSLVSLYWTVPDDKIYEVFRILWHSMAYGNSLANPFIYNYISKDFRQAFKSILSCRYCWPKATKKRSKHLRVSKFILLSEHKPMIPRDAV